MPFINEAVWALHDGVADAEAIDTIAKLGFAHPIGPLALADLIGLDTCVAIMEVLEQGSATRGTRRARCCASTSRRAAWAGRAARASTTTPERRCPVWSSLRLAQPPPRGDHDRRSRDAWETQLRRKCAALDWPLGGLRADARAARDPGARARLRAGRDRAARGRLGPGAPVPDRALSEAGRARADGRLRAGGIRRRGRGLRLVRARAGGALAGRRGRGGDRRRAHERGHAADPRASAPTSSGRGSCRRSRAASCSARSR